ncbi:MAG: DUF3408 domain-containing protein [Rikenellaceae bacterium]
MLDENSIFTQQTEYNQQPEQPKCITQKQRKKSREKYRQQFLTTPKIVDRQTLFISRDLRDKIDKIVRQLGDRKLSVSGFAQNVLKHHLEQYADDIEQWRKM